MGMSSYLAAELQDHVLGVGDYTPPATVYLALHTADPGVTGLNEVAGGSYIRQAVDFASASPGSGNSGTAVFDGLLAVTVKYMSLWDAASGGNMLYYGATSSDIVVADGGGIEVSINDIIVQMGN